MSKDTANHYWYPDWGCLADFFPIWGWKIACVELSLLDLNSQSGTYNLSAMAILRYFSSEMIVWGKPFCSWYFQLFFNLSKSSSSLRYLGSCRGFIISLWQLEVKSCGGCKSLNSWLSDPRQKVKVTLLVLEILLSLIFHVSWIL